MEPKFRTSFIPKQTLKAAAGGGSTRRSGAGGIISLLALVIVLGAIVLSVALFLYQQLLDSSIDRKAETLERARAAFEPALIEELVRLDTRIESAERILDTHIAPSAMFDTLEALTLRSVQFTDFNFTRISNERMSISMSGIAGDFNDIALQADIFGKNKIIKEPKFSDLNLDQAGRAVFKVTAFIDPTLINFINRTQGATAPVNQGQGGEEANTSNEASTL